MAFLKKLLVGIFLLFGVGFFFYVFYTQVFSPLSHDSGHTRTTLDFSQIVKGYFDTLYHLIIEPLHIHGL